MRDDDFAIWLKQIHKTKNGSPLTPKAQGDAMSRCRRIEIHEGNLDEHFNRDKMETLLRRLNTQIHNVPITGKNIAKSEATLRNAVSLYCSFCFSPA